MTATPNYFRGLGVAPSLGRIYEDEKAGGVNEAVLSRELWVHHFGGSSDVLGKTIRISGTPFIVVGVMPALPRDLSIGIGDVWTPLHRYDIQKRRAASFRARYLRVIGRLKPDLSLQQAQSRMSVLQAQLAAEPGSVAKGYSVVVESLRDAMVGRLKTVLWLLFASVWFVLLTACANVANLSLARGVSREKDISIRLAVGAGYRRILRELLTENLLLCGLGAVAGLAVAYGSLFLLKYYLVARIPRLSEAGLNAPVLLFTVGMVVACSLAVTAASFLGYLKLNLNQALRESGRTGAGGVRRQRLRTALVASEVVFAVLLSAGAGFLLKSFGNLLDIRPGFDVERRVVVDIVLPANLYNDDQKRSVFYREMFRRLSETGGIEAAGGSLYFPCRPKVWLNAIWREGVETPEGQEPIVYYNLFAGDYFRTMAIPLRRGRWMTEQEVWERRNVILINESFARQLYPGTDPLGRRVKLGRDGNWLTIVGIVGDVRQRRLDEDPKPEFYVPFAEMPMPFLTVVAKTSAPADRGATLLRSAVRDISSNIALHDLMPLEALVGDTISSRRLALILLLLFSALALGLAAVGIYGIVSYAVGQRRQEIGLRIALGADRGDILRLIVGGNMRVVTVAVAVGLVCAAAASSGLQSLLYGVKPGDWSIYAGASLVTFAAALLASLLPALSAARVDPLETLRQE
jgi:predicted permease